jgi:hypothetical protein
MSGMDGTKKDAAGGSVSALADRKAQTSSKSGLDNWPSILGPMLVIPAGEEQACGTKYRTHSDCYPGKPRLRSMQ